MKIYIVKKKRYMDFKIVAPKQTFSFQLSVSFLKYAQTIDPFFNMCRPLSLGDFDQGGSGRLGWLRPLELPGCSGDLCGTHLLLDAPPSP